MLLKKMVLCIGTGLLLSGTISAQGLLSKMKQKASQVADKVIDKKVDEALGTSGGNNNNNNSSGSGSSGSTGNSTKSNKSNNGGEGLISTPPDVKENLGSAEAAFKGGNYGETRYAIQQAMLGVELEIGQAILKSLPEAVTTLKKNTTTDQVTSTGWGWAGLTIRREYEEGDKQLTITIANNAVWMQAINLYFNNAGYAQSNGGEQKMKQIKIKGYRSVIEFDKNSGYKISIPLGQTSLVMVEGINFRNEQEITTAANLIDLDSIKAKLGEK
jgi:hypothetical protein